MHKRPIKSVLFCEIMTDFRAWMTRLNYATHSIEERTRHLHIFFNYLENQSIDNTSKIDAQVMENYNQYLHNQAIKGKTIQGYIGALKLCNTYLENHDKEPILKAKLQITKELESPRNIVSSLEIEKLYQICTPTIWGMRDRAILAIYYGCGLRCNEGIHIEINDINFSTKLIHVRQGKGNKERYVPMSEGVVKELKDWLENGHRYFVKESKYVLPNSKGKATTRHGLNKRIKALCNKAEIKETSLHGLRHSIASHLLASGMSLDQIGLFLGHSSLESTQIYTKIER
jgi:integrase/recombinase XerD